MIAWIAGLILSLFGSLPPGLISLSVARTSINRGWGPAFVLSVGAAVAEFFQAWISVVFTDWFFAHPGMDQVFRWAALPVFFGLGAYLLFRAPMPRDPDGDVPAAPWRQLLRGLVLSFFNLLALPYWFAYCGWLRLQGWWQEGIWHALIFSAGVSFGTLLALTLYAGLGRLAVRRADVLARRANGLVGLIFLGLGFALLWGLVKSRL